MQKRSFIGVFTFLLMLKAASQINVGGFIKDKADQAKNKIKAKQTAKQSKAKLSKAEPKVKNQIQRIVDQSKAKPSKAKLSNTKQNAKKN